MPIFKWAFNQWPTKFILELIVNPLMNLFRKCGLPHFQNKKVHQRVYIPKWIGHWLNPLTVKMTMPESERISPFHYGTGLRAASNPDPPIQRCKPKRAPSGARFKIFTHFLHFDSKRHLSIPARLRDGSLKNRSFLFVILFGSIKTYPIHHNHHPLSHLAKAVKNILYP